jgi:hypothetical protein
MRRRPNELKKETPSGGTRRAPELFSVFSGPLGERLLKDQSKRTIDVPAGRFEDSGDRHD